MNLKTPRKTKAEPASYKAKATGKVRRSAPKNTSRSNGKSPLATYEYLHVGVVQSSLDGTYLDVNEEFCRMMGYSKQELLQLSVRDCTHEDDYVLDLKLHEQLVSGKIPFYGLEERLVRKDGRVVWVELTRSLVRDAKGKPLCTMGVVTDVSEYKQVERVLRESAENLRIATEAARMFKWELDFQKQLYTFADSFSKVLGFSADLLPQNSVETVWKLSPQEDIRTISEAIAKAVENHSDLKSLQYRMINPQDGQTVWLEANAKIVYDAQGSAQRMFGVAQNITEEKKAQEEIRILSKLPEENPNPVMRLTPDGQILYANTPSRDLMEVWKQQTDQAIPPELKKHLAETFASGVKKEIEITQNGRTFSCTLAPIADAGYVNLYGNDVTESRQIAQELTRERELLTRLVETMPVMVSMYDPDTQALRLNAEFERRIGWKTEEMTVLSLLESIYPDPDYRMQVIQRMSAAGRNEWVDVQVQTRDGRTLDSIWSNISILNGRQIGIGVDITERKRMENALRESEERFRAIFSQATAGIAQSDVDSRLIFVNPKLCEMLGYPESELIGKTIWEFTDERDVEENRRLYERLMAQGDAYQFEKRFVRRDGSVLWASVSVSAIHDAAGKVAGGVGVVVDITPRRQMEEVLRAKELELEEIINRTPFMLTRCSRDLRYRFVSETYARMIGRTPEEVAGKPIVEIMGEEGLKTISPYIEKVLQGEQAEYETEVPFPGIKAPSLHVIYTPDRDEQGNVIGWFASITDVTERKKIEEALWIENQRFMRFISSNIVGILIGDTNGKVILANDYYLRTLGVSRQDLMEGKVDWKKFTPPEWLPADEKAIRELRERGVCEPYEKEYIRADGTRVPVYIADAMLPGPGEEIAAFLLDITERKRSEQALTEYARQQEALYQLSDRLHHTDSLEDVYRAALDAILSGLQCDRASILLFDERDVMRFVAWRGLSDGYRQATEGHSPWGRDAKNPYPICIHDVLTSDLSDSLKATIQEEGIASLAFIPLVLNGRLIGKFMVYFDSLHECGDNEIELGLMIARQLAVGIDRKRNEERLRESEERLRVTFDTAVVGFATLTPDARFLEVNDAFCQIVGYSRAELLAMDCAALTHPFYLESTYEHVNQLVEGKIPSFVLEKLYVRKDGAEIWVQNNVSIVRRADGTPLHLIAICQDITARRQSEEKLRASEALYRTIARSIPGGGVYVVDRDFRYLVAEGPVTEAFGLSRERLEGQTVWEAFPDERGEKMKERLIKNFAGETVKFETEYNGRVYWTQQAPLRDTIGQAIIVTIDITERKRVEDALRQSEERFARFMQHLPGLAWIKDVQGRYVYANAAAEKAFSTPREKLYGRTDSEIFPANVAAQFRKNDEQALTNEKGLQVVETLRQDDDVLHYSLVSKFPIPGPEGNPALIGGTAFDITERLHAEEALRESEERFRAILRQATAGIVRKDSEGRFIFVNQAFCNMLGYTESELLGKTFWQFTHHEDIPENKRLYDRMMVEGTPFKLEKRIIRRDGSILWVDVSVSPVMGAEGKPQSAVAVEVDITGRKQAEEALHQLNLQLESRVQKRTATIQAMNQSLREEIAERKRVEEALRVSEATARVSEEKLRTLFDLLPVGISFLDPEGQVIETNSALLNILKLSREQLLAQAYKSRTYLRVDGTPMPATEFAGVRALAENRTIYNVETGITLENDEVIWTSVSAAPVDVADVGAVVVTVDTTESKRAERALQESHGRLRVLSQRLVEVQEEERRALARELHDRVGQTLAALNINLIIINSQLTPEVTQQIGARLNDSMKLVAETIALVRDVMTDLRPAVLDDYGLEAALEAQVSGFKSRYTIGIVFEKADRPIPRLGPSLEMTFLRIAQEALMNIAKHAHAEHVHVALRQEGESICLTVQDDGTGIGSWQDANRPGSHGLTIMRERAEAFGGTLNVRSIPGQGTTVEASIPYNKNKGREKIQEEQGL